MTIFSAQQLAAKENLVLQPYAVHSLDTRGRKYPEPEDFQRLPFQKDRDRIIHSRAFRRLKEKTQVFVAHYGDHYRTRLAHSLEVAQVSRDLARMLGLNEDLSEAIALAHDLGHTPFGHAGEHALDECLKPYGLRFEHNEQSRRIVEELEEVYPDWKGLNLSVEVIEGLMKHHTSWDHPNGGEHIHPSLEAQVVNYGDEIAYQNHDVDDGLRSGIFTEADLETLAIWQSAKEKATEEYGPIADEKIRWARQVSKMISLMIVDIAVETSRRLAAAHIKTLKDVYHHDGRLVSFSPQMEADNKALKDFLTTHLYFHPKVLKHSERGQGIIWSLFAKYTTSSTERGSGKGVLMTPEKARDFIAGMTDGFAAQQLGHPPVPAPWQLRHSSAR